KQIAESASISQAFVSNTLNNLGGANSELVAKLLSALPITKQEADTILRHYSFERIGKRLVQNANLTMGELWTAYLKDISKYRSTSRQFSGIEEYLLTWSLTTTYRLKTILRILESVSDKN